MITTPLEAAAWGLRVSNADAQIFALPTFEAKAVSAGISRMRLMYGHRRPLNELDYSESLESAKLLILPQACNAGSREGEHYSDSPEHQRYSGSAEHKQCLGANKEKGSTANAALWNYSPDNFGSVNYETFVVQFLGSSFAFLRWRRLISPRIDVTMNCASVSFGSLTYSISLSTSSGTRAVFCCDLLLVVPVAITDLLTGKWCSVYARKKIKKGLKCKSPRSMVYFEGDLHLEEIETQMCYQHRWASNHNVTEVYTMASSHSTQTRPEFTWLFLGSRKNDTCLPTILRTQATTEAEARNSFPGWHLTFSAKIRTDRQLVTPWTDPDAKMIWAVMAIDVSDFSPASISVQDARHD